MWVCVFCGKPVPPSCPHPSVNVCCGEVGQVTEIDDDEEADHENYINHMREVAMEGTR